MQTILSGFLAAGLLQIGEDDEKLKLLEAAAVEVAKQLKATPLMAHRFVLVGLDAKVSASDPVFQAVEAAVLEKWQTITNKVGAGPTKVYRAVILRAIELAASENQNIGWATVLAAWNQPAGLIPAKEASALSSLLERFEEAKAKELVETWVSTVDLSIPKLASKVKKPQVSKEELTAGLARAVGPSDKDGKANPSPNPHWPNAGQPWSFEFAGRAAEAVSNAIQSATKGFAEEVQEAVRESLQGVSKGLERMAVRDAKADLLWIKASLYSPSARRSYRDLDQGELSLHSSLDVSRAVSAQAPVSVEFFVRELVRDLCTAKAKLSDTLRDFGPKLATLPEAQALAKVGLPSKGRRSLLDYSWRPNPDESFEAQTGFKSSFEQPISELAVRFYREMQILKLLSSA